MQNTQNAGVHSAVFRWLLLLGALGMSSTTGYFSVIGFASNFGGAALLMLIGGSLEAGKLLTVTYLHRYGSRTHWLFYSFGVLVAVVLVAVSSLGIFGYLTKGMDDAMLAKRQTTEQVAHLTTDLNAMRTQLAGLDTQLANLPAEYGATRIKVYNTLNPERERLAQQITAKQAALQAVNQKREEADKHVGMIRFVADFLHVTPEAALLAFALIVTLAFDPLAITLFVFYNTAVQDDLRAKLAEQADRETVGTPVAAVPEPAALPDVDVSVPPFAVQVTLPAAVPEPEPLDVAGAYLTVQVTPNPLPEPSPVLTVQHPLTPFEELSRSRPVLSYQSTRLAIDVTLNAVPVPAAPVLAVIAEPEPVPLPAKEPVMAIPARPTARAVIAR